MEKIVPHFDSKPTAEQLRAVREEMQKRSAELREKGIRPGLPQRGIAPTRPTQARPTQASLISPMAPSEYRSHMPSGLFEPPLVDDASWNRMVLENPKPVAVVFTMVGCMACTSLKQTAIQELKRHYQDDLEILEFQCSTHTRMDKELDATGHPTFVFFNQGNEVGIYLGYSQAQYYINYIRTNKAIGLNR